MIRALADFYDLIFQEPKSELSEGKKALATGIGIIIVMTGIVLARL